MYYRLNFLNNGDKLKSSKETIDFHKGHMYEIAKVFHDKGKIRYSILNKQNKEVLLPTGFNHYLFDIPQSLSTKLKTRAFDYRLKSFWNFNDTVIYSRGHKFNLETCDYYEIENKAHFSTENTIARISKHNRKINLNEDSCCKYLNYEHFNCSSYEDFVNYFKSSFKDLENDLYHLVIEHIGFNSQEKIDIQTRIIEDNLQQVNIELSIADIFLPDFYNYDLSEFKTFLAELIFDKSGLTDQEYNVIFDIIELYKLLPNSHGATSVAKILNGNTKLKQENINDFIGKYKSIVKFDQLFTLADLIATYFVHKEIFVEKKIQSEEWLGQFEYIGSKYVDKTKLNELMILFKN